MQANSGALASSRAAEDYTTCCVTGARLRRGQLPVLATILGQEHTDYADVPGNEGCFPLASVSRSVAVKAKFSVSSP
ncbi:hypothetical protein VTK26DRAFT_7425 [Humicola hyalothermophila]